MSVVLRGSPLSAQSSYFAATVGFELMEQRLPVYDVTFLYRWGWGLRYSKIADFDFEEEKEILSDADSVSSYTVSGDFEMPSLIYVIEKRGFSGRDSGPFDFLAAYTAVGYGRMDVTLQETAYRAAGGKIAEEERSRETDIPVYALSFGFLGGEKFAALDVKVTYVKGVLDDSRILNRKMEFDHWLALFSLGFGF